MWWIYLIYKLSKLLYPKYSDKNRLGTRNLIFFPLLRLFQNLFRIMSELCHSQKKKRTLIYEENCILGHDDTRCCQPAEL